MMLGRFHQEETKSISLSTYTPAPRAALMTEEDMEDYLDHACAPLLGQSSYKERQRVRADIRTQLEAIITAYQELGHSREEAVGLTLQSLCKESATQENTSAAVTVEQARQQQSRSLALRSFGITSAISLAGLFASTEALSASPWIFFLLFFWLPLATGVFVGGNAQTRPVRSTLQAIGLLTLPTLLADYMWAQRAANPGQVWVELSIVHLTCWTLSSTMGATVGNGMRCFLKRCGVLREKA